MAETTAPVVFCAAPPFSCPGPLQVRLPFGLPVFTAPDTSCEGIKDLLDNITVSLSGFMPILKLADCLLKAVTFITKLPGLISPPKISDIARYAEEVAGCAELLSEFSGQNYVAYCRVVKDILNVIICVLSCIREMLQLVAENDTAAASLAASPDLSLQEMGLCLQGQTVKLKLDISLKLNSVGIVILFINALLTALPPLAAVAGTSSIDFSESDMTIEKLTTIITSLQSVVTLLDVCG